METLTENKLFESGSIVLNGKQVMIASLPWNPNPTFHGVALKHLIKGEETDNRLSCHIVKINPDCEIGIHNHAGKVELHEIVAGSGFCLIDNVRADYQPGTTALIPADIDHKVIASDDGLYLLAKFFSALL